MVPPVKRHNPAAGSAKNNHKKKPARSMKVVAVGLSRNKNNFKDLQQQQKQLELTKQEKRQQIEEKRKVRDQSRNERNKVMRKLTKKGQPIMKDRIKYMLTQLENMRK